MNTEVKHLRKTPDVKHKVHSLTGRISMELMNKAFKAVKRNRGAAGIDKVSIQNYEANLRANLAALMKALKDRSFEPKPLRRKYVEKDNGSLRPLGIPCVRDRVAQEVLRSLLDPIFDKQFHRDSYGFRRGRNAHQAAARIQQLYADGYKVVLEADIRGFFDEIPHDLIVDAVAETIADGNILALIRKFLTSGVMEDGSLKPTHKGTPQGGVISPLLANVVLNKLDWALEAAGYKSVRYADDFVVLTKTPKQAERAMALVQDEISSMGLTLHPDKTLITSVKRGFEFLGFRINHRGCQIRPKAVEKLKDKIRKITVRSHNLDAQVIDRLNRLLRGTSNYFMPGKLTTGANQWRSIDKWLRKRIRCMKYTRINKEDNRRLHNKHIRRLGLYSVYERYHEVKANA